jgi:hypothetical protein
MGEILSKLDRLRSEEQKAAMKYLLAQEHMGEVAQRRRLDEWTTAKRRLSEAEKEALRGWK